MFNLDTRLAWLKYNVYQRWRKLLKAPYIAHLILLSSKTYRMSISIVAIRGQASAKGLQLKMADYELWFLLQSQGAWTERSELSSYDGGCCWCWPCGICSLNRSSFIILKNGLSGLDAFWCYLRGSEKASCVCWSGFVRAAAALGPREVGDGELRHGSRIRSAESAVHQEHESPEKNQTLPPMSLMLPTNQT